MSQVADVLLSLCCSALACLRSEEPNKATRRARLLGDLEVKAEKILTTEYQSQLHDYHALEVAKNAVTVAMRNMMEDYDNELNDGTNY
jgi:hypothetical protein